MLRLHSYKKLWYKSYKLYDSFIVNTVIFMSDKWLLLLLVDRHNFKRTITALQKLWKLNFNLEALAVLISTHLFGKESELTILWESFPTSILYNYLCEIFRVGCSM